MPENVPNQTFSKVYARPILNGEPPRSNDRKIIYLDSCCALPFETKRAEELLDYTVDMMNWLEPNEDVIGAAAWCDPDSLIMTRLEYTATGIVAWLAGGGDDVRQTVNVEVSTSLGRIKLVQFIVHTFGTAEDLAIVTANDIAVDVGLNTQPPIDPVLEPLLVAYPSIVNFPEITASISEASVTINLKNEGNATAFIHAYSMQGPFHQSNNGIIRIDPNAVIQVTITYKPQSKGSHIGLMSVDYGNGLTQVASFSGSAVSSSRLKTSGNQITRLGGEKVKLKAINWFGAESELYTPHGLWARNYKDIIDQIATMGFNCVRLPFSGDICNVDRMVSDGAINFTLNDDLIGKTAIQVFDQIIQYFNQKKIWIILDHHRCYAGDGADGSPIAENYGLNQWKNSWSFMVNRYSNLEFMLGADLHNEPYRLEWVTWASYAEDVANEIHAIAPHLLIFVEGVGRYGSSSYWWGGELSGVADRPINLVIPNRLVYSVHEYGISVGEQTWLAKDDVLPTGWPYNLYSVWHDHWGYIFEQNIAPIFIGEVGGKFGIDGNGNITDRRNSQLETQWIYHLQQYMDGHFDGDNNRQLDDHDLGISFAYWSINPNSGDTGGLLQDDWVTEQSYKLRLINMMLNDMTLPYVFGLTPIDGADIEDQGKLILNQNGIDFAVSIEDFKNAMNDRTFEAGHVFFFAENIDPNDRFIGQVWVKVPGAGKSIRLAATDGSDILATGGSDTVTIAKANLPATALTLTGTAASVDLGTKTTTTSGSHSHTIHQNGGIGTLDVSGGDTQGFTGDDTGALSGSTDAAGSHSHNFVLGSHSHTVSGSTENMGSGNALTITNQFIKLAAWYRVS